MTKGNITEMGAAALERFLLESKTNIKIYIDTQQRPERTGRKVVERIAKNHSTVRVGRRG